MSLKTSESIQNLAQAIFNARKKMEAVTKSAENPFFKSKYADLNSILDVVTDPLEAEGILVLQPTTSDGVSNFVTTRLIHLKSGEFIESTLKLELSKTTMQELGSAVSYARRYTLQSLLRLQAEDDDGNVASGKTATVTKGSFKKAKNNQNVEQAGQVIPPTALGDDW